MLLTSLLIAVVLYLLLCALLYAAQERLIFHPDVLPPAFAFDFPLPFTELRLPVAGATLHALYFRARQPKGAILYLPGNAGSLRWWGMVAQHFVPRGYDLLIPDYRGFGKSTSRITREALLHADAWGAYAYLQQHYPAAQIIVYGYSLGTGLATQLAARQAPRLLILEAPYVSLRALARRRFPFVPMVLLKYPLRTDRWIGQVGCPVYLVHGTADEVIPCACSLQLLPLIQAPHALITIAGGRHTNLAAFGAYQAALDAILGPPVQGDG
jgi:pimeloyl-ACP methyl ester carboxylesterase